MAAPATSALLKVADDQWKHWGKATWNCITGAKPDGFHIDDETKFAQYVIDNYLPPFYKKPIKWPTVAVIGPNDDYAWSAVAMSYIMLQAGFARKKLHADGISDQKYGDWVAATGADEFPASESHSHYIRWAIRARRDKVLTVAFWGYRVDEAEAVPEAGDLIGYARAKGLTPAKALKFFDKTGGYNSHTDLVVDKRPGEIDVIGGNVRDSVTKKTLAINSAGQIIDKENHWFVVMKRRV